jgi:hypothetical protein
MEDGARRNLQTGGQGNTRGRMKKNFLARDGIIWRTVGDGRSGRWPGLSSFKCHMSKLNSIANGLDLADEFARAISYEPYFHMIYDN